VAGLSNSNRIQPNDIAEVRFHGITDYDFCHVKTCLQRPAAVALRHQSALMTGSMTKRYHTAMTRSDLIAAIASRFPSLVAKDTDVAVKVILDAMGNALAEGNRIEIRGFGSFDLNYRPARTGRNPKTGVTVPVAAKYVPHFKAGKELRESVDAPAALSATSGGTEQA